MKVLPLVSLNLVLLLSIAAAADEKKPEKPEENPGPNRAELEKKFAAMLSGATLVGNFTVTGKKETPDTKPEKYTISKVSKLAGDVWVFQTRIQYGDHDVNVPLPLPVRWAGDTPMVQLDGVPVPGIGTFKARVLFYDNQYAGTWAGKNHGGHLFGKIIPAKKEGGDDKDKSPKQEK